MADDQAQGQSLGNTVTNPNRGSFVQAPVAGESAMFLRPETGEILGVPAEDFPEFRSHYCEMSDVIAEYQSAIGAVQACDELLQEQALDKASGKVIPSQEADQAQKASGWAWEWHDEAHDKLKEKLKPLDAINGAGTKIVELIALSEKTGKERKEEEAKDRGVKFTKGELKKKIAGFSSLSDMKKQVKFPKKPYEKVAYVHSNKLKAKWPTFKDEDATKWSEVYKKDSNGHRKIDRKKLDKYVHEQVKKAKISCSDFTKIELKDKSGVLGEWAENWNQDHTYQKEGKLRYGKTQLADVDFSAGAQLMRYTYGGSIDWGFTPLKPGVDFKAEGHAEFAVAEAKAAVSIDMPSKDGWLWYLYDKQGTKHDLVAVLCSIELNVSAASISGELSLKAETKTQEPPKLAGKRGVKKKRQRRQAAINRAKDNDVGELDAEVKVFAGVKADAEAAGALKWRNPESKGKEFKEIADIKAGVGGMAGLAGEAQFKVEVTDDGIFRITAHASLCFGLGAEGEITFAVSAVQIGEFFVCIFYHMMLWEFKNLELIAPTAFAMLQNLVFLTVKEGEAIAHLYGQATGAIQRRLRAALDEFEQAETAAKARQDLANKVLNNQKALESIRYAPPEAKGMLIYQLTRHNFADFQQGNFAVGMNYLQQQKRAVLVILKCTQIKREAENVIQHIGPNGEKGDFNSNLTKLREFFRTGAPRDLLHTDGYDSDLDQVSMNTDGFPPDQLALNGDFGAWFSACHGYLMDTPRRGYAVASADSLAYQLLKSGDDHPFYTSSGDRAYYRNVV
jgi:hypothetical protein